MSLSQLQLCLLLNVLDERFDGIFRQDKFPISLFLDLSWPHLQVSAIYYQHRLALACAWRYSAQYLLVLVVWTRLGQGVNAHATHFSI